MFASVCYSVFFQALEAEKVNEIFRAVRFAVRLSYGFTRELG